MSVARFQLAGLRSETAVNDHCRLGHEELLRCRSGAAELKMPRYPNTRIR